MRSTPSLPDDTRPAAPGRNPWPAWLPFAAALVVLLLLFRHALQDLAGRWRSVEYGHGWLALLFAGAMLWQRRVALAGADAAGAWLGVGVVLLAMLVAAAGRLTTISMVDQFAVWLCLLGLVWANRGRMGARILLPCFLLLLLALPVPSFLFNNLMARLQWLCAGAGVEAMRAVGVSVLLQGNVIDFGGVQWPVAQACGGLRLLLPMMTMAAIVAGLLPLPRWSRVLLFASMLPITLAIVSLRVAVAGVLIAQQGRAPASGVQAVEVVLLFVVGLACLLIEGRLLMRLHGDGRPLRAAIGMTFPAGVPMASGQPPSAAAWVAVVLVAALGGAVAVVPERDDIIPARATFAGFPMTLGEWRGTRDWLSPDRLQQMKADDYIKADYRGADGRSVGFYAAYYQRQRTGDAVHSPRTCIPGAGWQILSFRQQVVPVPGRADGLRLNRAIVSNGAARVLVYYWFQQRGRLIASEYAAKWYLMRDALTRNRTDGALVRLVTDIGVEEDMSDADARLARFAAVVAPLMPRFAPD